MSKASPSRIALLLLLLVAFGAQGAVECPRQLQVAEVERYFALLGKQDSYLYEISNLPALCDADRAPQDCPTGSLPSDTIQVVTSPALTPSESIELAALDRQILVQAYFSHNPTPLTAEEFATKSELESTLAGKFLVGSTAKKRRIQYELAQLNRRLWNGLARSKNDDLLRSILRNVSFPYGTRVLENGTVILGPFKPTLAFGWHYWAYNDKCVSEFEADCQAGKSNEAQREK